MRVDLEMFHTFFDGARVPEPCGSEQPAKPPSPSKTRLKMSVQFALSLAVLILAAITYFVSLATTNWSASGQVLRMGIWEFCVMNDGNGSWKCFPCIAEFSMAAQAFSILSVMCYACAFVLYFLYLIFPTLHKSRPLMMGLCLICFSVVSLQIMTMVVYGVKVRQYYFKIERKYFSALLEPLYMSWSFAFAIVSTILSTVAGICTFVELRNIALTAIVDV
ncbi:hypothetical protein ScPMuIL_006524 [Solemya velum]